MIETSASFNTKIAEASRTFVAKLFNDGTEVAGNIREFNLYKGSCGSDNFSVGCVYAPYLELTIDDCTEKLENEELLLQIGLALDDETVEFINLGYFTVTKPKTTAYQSTFTAVGRISSKLNQVCNIPTNKTIKNLADSITTTTGVPIIFKGLDTSKTITDNIGVMTCKDVLVLISSVLGGFATEDGNGNIVISKFSNENILNYDGDSALELPQFNDYDYTVDGVKVVIKEAGTDENGNSVAEVSYTSGVPKLVFSNKYMTKPLFDDFAENIIGYEYRPGTVPIALGDPRIEPWDCLKVTDVKGEEYIVPCMNIQHTFDGGLTTTVTAPGNSEMADSTQVKGPLTQQVEKIAGELIIAKEAIADRVKVSELEAKVATFGYMTANQADLKYASIDELNLVSGNVEKLHGDYSKFLEGEFDQLTVKVAELEVAHAEFVKIDELEAEIADFGYLKTDSLSAELATLGYLTANQADLKYALIEDLQATNANVENLSGDFTSFRQGEFDELSSKISKINTLMFGSATGNVITTEFSNTVVSHIGDAQIKSAMIKDLAFDKITGVEINTTNVNVHSNDGKSKWIDNTILISDASRPRVQIGKDASNDYNIYIWDATGKLMFDASGLTEDGIKREIIRNDMVSADANIDASKLNIQSVFAEMNESEYTLNSSHLIYNNEGLDLFLGKLTEEFAEHGESIKSQGTSIAAIQGKIANKVWQQDIDTATGEMNSKYSNLEQTISNYKVEVAETYTTKEDFESLEIGGRNLLLNGGVAQEILGGTTWRKAQYSLTEYGAMPIGETYTLTVDVTPGDGLTKFQLNNSEGLIFTQPYNLEINGTERQKVSITFKTTKAESSHIRLYALPNDGTQTGTTTAHTAKLEKGNRATDLTLSPEDEEASIRASISISSESIINEVSREYISKTESDSAFSTVKTEINALLAQIENLVVDENGSSLMTQDSTTAKWVFSVKELKDSIANNAKDLEKIDGDVKDIEKLSANLSVVVNSIKDRTAYISVGTDEDGSPCLELGTSSGDFKAQVTDTAIKFYEGTTPVAWLSNKKLHTKKAVIEEELQFGADSASGNWKQTVLTGDIPYWVLTWGGGVNG